MSYKILDSLSDNNEHAWCTGFITTIANNTKNLFDSISMSVPDEASTSGADYNVTLSNNGAKIVIYCYDSSYTTPRIGTFRILSYDSDGTLLNTTSTSNTSSWNAGNSMCVKSSYGLFIGSGSTNTRSDYCGALIFCKTNTGYPGLIAHWYTNTYMIFPELDLASFSKYSTTISRSSAQTTLAPIPLTNQDYINGVYIQTDYQSSEPSSYLFQLEDTLFAGSDGYSSYSKLAFRCT